MAEGSWGDWLVRLIAENMAEKCPKRDWCETSGDQYQTSLKSWSHIAARKLYSMGLDERQLIIFIHHLGVALVGVETFDPQDKGLHSDFNPHEGRD